MPEPAPNKPGAAAVDRRRFSLGFCAAAGGLAASYGTFGWFAARYLYPSAPAPRRWVFVASMASLEGVSAIPFQAPDGARINIARLGRAGTVEDFIALSSVCPHLGCQVHWEAQRNRFFCPCHNGVFDPLGRGIGGPPGDARQNLPRYPLKIENGLLFIEVPDTRLTSRADARREQSGSPSSPTTG